MRAAALLAVSTPLSAQTPDAVFFNGHVITVDEGFRTAQAFSIAKNMIVRVGTNEDVLATSAAATKKYNLQGRTVIPGLIDDHTHLLSAALSDYLGVKLPGVSSREDMLRAIGAKAAKSTPGQLLYVGSDWLTDVTKKGNLLDRGSLDRVAPQNPIIADGGGHTLYLNSAALALAGITRDTASPDGGLIHKDDKTGEPTGLLIDNAQALATRLIPEPTHQDRMEALRAAQQKVNSVGVTGLREPGLTPEDMRAYTELWTNEDLTIRVSMNLSLDPERSTEELIQQLEGWGVGTGFGDRWLRLDGIGEFGIDGGFEAALMTKPYEELGSAPAPAGYVGLQIMTTEKFEAVMGAMARLNWRASVHVVGDRGLDIVLGAYAKAKAVKDIGPYRWILEHCHYTRPDQFEAIKKLGLSISTQYHPYMAADTMSRNWGKERGSETMRVRDWIDAGIRVGGGSDWPMVPVSPFVMMHFFVTRETSSWGVVGPKQKITRAEALRMFTINNAYLTFDESFKGSIEAGKVADFVIISDDILAIPERSIKNIRALATFVDGRVVYTNPEFRLQND
jgi:predicted amidohydrolase YtcJ